MSVNGYGVEVRTQPQGYGGESRSVAGYGKLGFATDNVSQIPPQASFTCDVCGKVCKNLFGITGHKRSHK